MTDITVRSLADNVQGRVRSVIIDALPDEAVNKLIENEINEMLKPRNRGYDQRQTSEFQELVRKELNDHLRNRVTTFIAEQVQTRWTGNDMQTVLGDELTKSVSRVGIEAIAANIITQAFYAMRQNIRT